jgi:hypothetical protein
MTYNFRLAPEAIWLIVNTVIGTILVQVLAALGAILAAATGGGFQGPGETKEADAADGDPL